MAAFPNLVPVRTDYTPNAPVVLPNWGTTLGNSLSNVGGAFADTILHNKQIARDEAALLEKRAYEEMLAAKKLRQEAAAAERDAFGYAQGLGLTGEYQTFGPGRLEAGLPTIDGVVQSPAIDLGPTPDLDGDASVVLDPMAGRGMLSLPEGIPEVGGFGGGAAPKKAFALENVQAPAIELTLDDENVSLPAIPGEDLNLSVEETLDTDQVEKINRSAAYWRAIADKKLLEDKEAAIAARPKGGAQKNLRESAYSAMVSTAPLMRKGNDLLNLLSDPAVRNQVGALDTFWNKILRFTDEFGMGYDEAEVQNAIKVANLNSDAQTFVWEMLKAMQGSRPSDFDMQSYEQVLNVVKQISNPDVAYGVFEGFIEKAMRNGEAHAAYARALAKQGNADAAAAVSVWDKEVNNWEQNKKKRKLQQPGAPASSPQAPGQKKAPPKGGKAAK